MNKDDNIPISNSKLKVKAKVTLMIAAIASILIGGITINLSATAYGSIIEDIIPQINIDNIGQSAECVGVSVDCRDNSMNIDIRNGDEEPKPTTTLIVTKIVECESIITVACEDVDSNFEPQDFIITVTGQNPNPSQFGGSSSGTEVTLEPGAYEVTEDTSAVDGKIVFEDDDGNPIPPTTIDVFNGGITFSEDCSGTIEAGETKTCTIANPVNIL